jgi:hypothetical protein
VTEAPDVREYVAAVVRLYVWLPGTPSRASRQDRCVARSLFDQELPLGAVRAAMVMASARRAFRCAAAPPLPPIRTLFYFLPVLDEVLHTAPEPGYVDYLTAKLRPLAQQKAAERPIPQPSKTFTS